ncbi:putative pre-rrna processing protein [Botrytis fragariae]|uniref:Putative pre-rrna processing protein n=1 Tax=Botrytis fragariae TaxID=1964551 RepID=A0A8H6AL91_9HELO|nr:putative pre-rrna processing protein [Botrytis fragariae]KAF5869330.1 putative pre-rrna processing protein [Botrytis fragariae]
MSDGAGSPLLLSPEQRPSSKRSQRSVNSHDLDNSGDSHESSPLLAHSDDTPRYDGEEPEDEDGRIVSPAAESLRSIHNRDSGKSANEGLRWPTIFAVTMLFLAGIIILICAFFAPAIVEEYAKESLVIEPTNLSIDSFTANGVKARVQVNFKMDASRVKNNAVRNIGRFGTWIAKEVESQESNLEVYLPEYDNLLIGTAVVPKVVVNIQNGVVTPIDFVTDLKAGSVDGLRQVANDWLEGRLGQLRVLGKADVTLKSGLLPLGSQSNDIPAIPKYNITRLNFKEIPLSKDGHRGMAAEVSLSLVNSYPIRLSIPPMRFDILVSNCAANEPHIQLADATTDNIMIEPYSDVTLDVAGIVRDLPESLLQTCPNSHSSPLDLLLSDYIHGNDTTIFVRGSNAPSPETPDWITQIISSVTVPVPFPGHTFDQLIKNFSLTNTDFSLPGPFAEPGTPESNPRISGDIMVLAALPKEMNFSLDVSKVRAKADVFYKTDKLGVLNLQKWQEARSKRVNDKGDASLKIESHIKNAPLEITDEDVFGDLVADYYLGGKAVSLKIDALVEVEISTVLGDFIIKDLPAEGVVPLKPISTGGDLHQLNLKVGDLKIFNTGRTSINLQAKINFTNPTEYTARIPYVNIHILNNGSIIGDATVRDISVSRGNNTNVLVEATWDPMTFGGEKGRKIGRELISQYVSGFNTTLTFETHEGSIPYQPKLGKALGKFAVTMPTPRLSTPGTGKDKGPDDGKPHFIDDATFHLFSSTAQFTLLSPLRHSTIYIESIDAEAFYNHTETVGKIVYDYPFAVPPGASESPKLPVDWSFDGVGYDAVERALGGTLKLDAKGTIGLRLGQWTETIWYLGTGIGAHVRL